MNFHFILQRRNWGTRHGALWLCLHPTASAFSFKREWKREMKLILINYTMKRMNEWIKCCNKHAFRFWLSCGISISFPEGCGLQNFVSRVSILHPQSTGQLNVERKNHFFTVSFVEREKKKYLNRFTFEKRIAMTKDKIHDAEKNVPYSFFASIAIMPAMDEEE